MESQRGLLFIGLMVVTYLLFSQWQLDNAPVTEQAPITQQANTTTNNDGITDNNANESDFVPESSQQMTKTVTDSNKVNNANIISVKTDVLAIKINTDGGDIIEAKLLKFDTEQGNGIPFTVLKNNNHRYIAQSGLTGMQGIDRIERVVNKRRPIYHVKKTEYQTTKNQPLFIDLQYDNQQGIKVTKRFILNHDSYAIDVEYIIENKTNNAVSMQLYAQLRQSTVTESGSGLLPTYRGPAYSSEEDIYEKYDFDDVKEKNLDIMTKGGWVAMLEHYFVTSWVADKNTENNIYSRYFNKSLEATVGIKAPAITIDANNTASTKATFYVGPKDQDVLEKIEENLDLTIDYGFLSMISQPLHWLMSMIQSGEVNFSIFGMDVNFNWGGVGNWGIAIIIITLIVKGGMYPLTKAQYTSMAKMRALQPKMTKLKERFGDDRQKMSQGMMELYKKEKVNPAGGCLPLLIQMPIFLALYWVFLEAVELRHAPFMLWIQDLSAQDPYYILPVLMGISMFIMQKMQPVTVQDPMQQKIMQYMPVMFTVFFFFFPSGLVLYWLVSNIISIIQMKIIFSGIEKAKEKKA